MDSDIVMSRTDGRIKTALPPSLLRLYDEGVNLKGVPTKLKVNDAREGDVTLHRTNYLRMQKIANSAAQYRVNAIPAHVLILAKRC